MSHSTPIVAPPHRQVVVCSDGSGAMAAANRGAELLAHASGAELRLVHVFQMHSPYFERLRQDVQDVGSSLQAGVDNLALERGDALDVARPLLRYLAERPDALACVSSAGRGELHQAVLGSVAAGLVRASGRPILVFGPQAAVPERFSRVMACIDGSELADQVIPAAAGLASELRLPLWLVEVQPQRPRWPDDDVVDAATVRQRADRLSGQPVEVCWEILHDRHPAEAIVQFAGAEPGTITALATRGRGGLAGALLGSVAHDVVRRAPGPTLLLHPSAAARTDATVGRGSVGADTASAATGAEP